MRLRLPLFVTSRLLFAALAADVMGSIVVFLAMAAESSAMRTLAPHRLVLLLVGVGVLLLPFALFLAVAWLCISMNASDSISLFSTSGISRARLARIVGMGSVAISLFGVGVGELVLPTARDFMAPALQRNARHGGVMMVPLEQGWAGLEPSGRLDRLTDAWLWDHRTLQHQQALAFDGATWKTGRGDTVALPSPSQLVAQQPGFLDLLSVGELWSLYPSSRTVADPVRLCIFERLLRPLFWSLYLVVLALVLLRLPRSLWQSALLTASALLIGIALVVVPRDWGFSLASSPLGMLVVCAPTALLLLGLGAASRRGGTRRVESGR